MKFPIKDFFSKCDKVTFTEEILNGKLHILCSANLSFQTIFNLAIPPRSSKGIHGKSRQAWVW